MTIYTEDGIRQYEILERERKRQGKTLRQVADGVYSLSMLRRIETGMRLPGKLEKDRIMGRLGIPRDVEAEYLPCKEYRAWQMRQAIVQSIARRDLDKLEGQLAEYEKQAGCRKLEKQFLEVARYMLLKLQEAPKTVLQKTIKKAVDYTILDVEEALAGRLMLDEQELFILQEYACLNEKESGICMEKFCELYREPECYCINEVIKERRKTLGMSRRELAEDICSEKTIMRLENYGTMTQMYVVTRVFKRLGIGDKMLNKGN